MLRASYGANSAMLRSHHSVAVPALRDHHESAILPHRTLDRQIMVSPEALGRGDGQRTVALCQSLQCSHCSSGRARDRAPLRTGPPLPNSTASASAAPPCCRSALLLLCPVQQLNMDPDLRSHTGAQPQAARSSASTAAASWDMAGPRGRQRSRGAAATPPAAAAAAEVDGPPPAASTSDSTSAASPACCASVCGPAAGPGAAAGQAVTAKLRPLSCHSGWPGSSFCWLA